MGSYDYPLLQTEEREQRNSLAMSHSWNVELKSACVEPPRFALYHNSSVFPNFLGSPGPPPCPAQAHPHLWNDPRGLPAGSWCRSVAWLWVCSCPRPAADLKGSASSSHPTPTVSLKHGHKHTRTQGHTEGVQELLRHQLCESRPLLAAIPTASLFSPPSPARPGVSWHLFQLRQLPAFRILES